jgi:hypothetical protein
MATLLAQINTQRVFMNGWLTCMVEEILPSKFFAKCGEMVKERWELSDIQSDHQSGFTIHRAMFMKYDTSTTDKELDDLYDLIDSLMKEGEWFVLNNLCDVWSSPHSTATLDTRLGIATATLPAKSKLPNRKVFMEECKRLHPDPEFWKGLE